MQEIGEGERRALRWPGDSARGLLVRVADADEILSRLLSRAPGGGFELRTIPRHAMDDALLEPLHAMANAQMAEPYAHFRTHAFTNDVLHVFRPVGSTRVVGFQFWRVVDGAAGRRVVLGGKLRVLPEARRRGLHLAAGLSVLLAERAKAPLQPLTRVGVSSLFGFVSVARRLDHYAFVTRGSRGDLVDVVEALTRASHFRFDPDTGLVDVGIFVTDAQLRAYPEAFFAGDEARAYLQRNPSFATNGCYLAYAFDVDASNLRTLSRGTCSAVLGEEAVAKAAFEAELANCL